MLRISYGCFESGVRGQNIEPFKTLAPNSRLTQELQEETTDYKIRFRTDYVSATNPKISQFVAIRRSSGRSLIPPLGIVTESKSPLGQSYAFLTYSGIRKRENKESGKRETKAPPLSNYAAT